MQARLECEECRRIVRVLRAAFRADQQALRTRIRDVAETSGRDVRAFGIRWVFSVAQMPDADMQSLLQLHYPTVAEATRTREAHEAATGHSLHGWWMRRHYTPDEE